MMTMKEALFAYLSNRPAISAVVGGTGVSPATIPRIYPLTLRQDPRSDGKSLPCLSYHRVAGDSLIDISGNRNRTGYARIQISVWSFDSWECERMIETLRLELTGQASIQMGDNSVQVTNFMPGVDIYDHISKISHSSCQITCYFKEA